MKLGVCFQFSWFLFWFGTGRPDQSDSSYFLDVLRASVVSADPQPYHHRSL